jgi:hypothetical protein
MHGAIAATAPFGDVILGTSHGGIADNLVVDDVFAASPIVAGPGQMISLVAIAGAAVFSVSACYNVAGTRRGEATLEINAFNAVGWLIEYYGLRCPILENNYQLVLGVHPTAVKE